MCFFWRESRVSITSYNSSEPVVPAQSFSAGSWVLFFSLDVPIHRWTWCALLQWRQKVPFNGSHKAWAPIQIRREVLGNGPFTQICSPAGIFSLHWSVLSEKLRLWWWGDSLLSQNSSLWTGETEVGPCNDQSQISEKKKVWSSYHVIRCLQAERFISTCELQQ